LAKKEDAVLRIPKHGRILLRGIVALSLLLCMTTPVMADESGGEGSRLDPEAGTAFYEGNALLVEGRLEDALSAFERALEISPDFYRVHLYRSRAYLNLGDAEGAQGALAEFEAAATSDAERLEATEQRKKIEALVANQMQQAAEASDNTAAEQAHGDVAESESTGDEEPTDVDQDEGSQEDSSATTEAEGAVPDTPDSDAAADVEEVAAGVAVDTSPAAVATKPPAVRVGLQGGYTLTRGTATYHWGTVQARFEVLIGKGFTARVQGGLGMQRDEDVVYFVVPAALGVTWRAPAQPRPYLDAHFLMAFYNDGKSADGSEVSGAARTPGIGGGGGGGIEIDLLQTNGASLSLAPEVHVGWAGIFVFQGGVSVRLAPTRSSGG